MDFEILNLSLNLTESILSFLLFDRLFIRRYASKKSKYLLITAVVTTTIFMYFSMQMELLSKCLFMMTIYLFFLNLMYLEKLYIKSAILILTVYSFLILDIICGHIFAIIFNRHFINLFNSDLQTKLIVCYLIKLINAVIIFSIYKSFKKLDFNIGRKEWGLLNVVVIVLFLISIAFISVYPSGTVDDTMIVVFLVSSIGFFVMSLIIVSFFSEICIYFQTQKKIYMLESNYKAIESQIELQRQLSEETRKIRHDLKNHVMNVQMLIQQNNLEMADELISQVKEEISNFHIGINHTTGNSLIDAIVSCKAYICSRRNIQFDYTLSSIPWLDIKSSEISSVLSNLIDNAIEASIKSYLPHIELKIFVSKSYLTFIVKNSYNVEPKSKNGKVSTSKEDFINHGYGMQIIKELAENNNGSYTYYLDEQYFISTVLMKI